MRIHGVCRPLKILRIAFVGLLLVGSLALVDHSSTRAADDTVELRLTLAGPRTTLLEVDEDGMSGSPDGHITFIRENGQIRVWSPVLVSTVELTTTNFWDIHSTSVPAQQVLSPSGSGFDSNYAGGSKVLRLSTGRLVMIYHGEHHPCTGDKAEVAIGLATSDDDGATWQRSGKILSAPPYQFSSCDDRQFYGVGSFSGVVSPDGTYLYLYHHVWHPRSYDITVSRSKIASGLGPGTWTRYYKGSWSQPGLGGLGTNLLNPPPGQEMAGIPSVSWNPTFKMWLAVFVTFKGFAYASSEDGLHWSTPRMLMRGVALVAPESMVDHQPFIYYPSLIDPHESQDGRTNRDAMLIYAYGGWTSAHHMVANKVTISSVRVRRVTELPPTGAGSDIHQLVLVAAGLLMLGVFSRSMHISRRKVRH